MFFPTIREGSVANQEQFFDTKYEMSAWDTVKPGWLSGYNYNTLHDISQDVRSEAASGSPSSIGGIVGLGEASRALRDSKNGIAKPEPVLSEEEFKQRFGNTIKYDPKTSTLTRAEILYKDAIEARDAQLLLDRNAHGFWANLLGYGAMFAAQLPDPINLIPLGGAARGARMVERIVSGAKAGALGTLAADAAIWPSSAERGREMNLNVVALDAMFGSLIGMGFGGIGGALHYRRLGQVDPNVRSSLNDALVNAGIGQSEATKLTDDMLHIFADTRFGEREADLLRRGISGVDRQNAGRLMERAIHALRNGEDMNVGKWMDTLGSGDMFERARREIANRSSANTILQSIAPEVRRIESELIGAGIAPEEARMSAMLEAMRAKGLQLAYDIDAVETLNGLKIQWGDIDNIWTLYNGGDSFEQIFGVKGAKRLDEVLGKTTLMDRLEKAREMEKNGKKAKTILYTTGWQRGADNLYRIAIKYYGDGSQANIEKIKQANNLTSDSISTGQVLIINP